MKLSFLVRSPCCHACVPVPQSSVLKSVFISLVIAAHDWRLHLGISPLILQFLAGLVCCAVIVVAALVHQLSRAM